MYARECLIHEISDVDHPGHFLSCFCQTYLHISRVISIEKGDSTNQIASLTFRLTKPQSSNLISRQVAHLCRSTRARIFATFPSSNTPISRSMYRVPIISLCQPFGLRELLCIFDPNRAIDRIYSPHRRFRALSYWPSSARSLSCWCSHCFITILLMVSLGMAARLKLPNLRSKTVLKLLSMRASQFPRSHMACSSPWKFSRSLPTSFQVDIRRFLLIIPGISKLIVDYRSTEPPEAETETNRVRTFGQN